MTDQLILSDARLSPTYAIEAMDEYGQSREVHVAGERPLTLKVDGQEIVTLMTLGNYPEALTLGYLRNQRLIDAIDEITRIWVDWDQERVDVTTRRGEGIQDERMQGRTVTTGCGQGTVFSCTLDKIYGQKLTALQVKQSRLYDLLRAVNDYNAVYRQAGAVHGCALCRDTEILMFVEDVGRHNAADAIAGMMWLEAMPGEDKIFYTTGRLTSEIVMKAAQMNISLLLSRSGVSHMGLELAQDLGITLIARAKGQHFLVYNGAEHITFDAVPVTKPQHRASTRAASA
ncbi:MAG: formate dehydrogenase accessory sulfurtransferase FdhD [Thiohalophilus sp.]|uniref:formate dehydrogenase accessory sulfurtransferase FdhD n=1 Tax=Thiohalophilus sp. TaxID=3028392 RepID=UPI00287066BF|nr:formate dehydrogenase accessory sulfurtransferase FdhD [Thiohalophilus sp.]MDR9436845.1 formate dehydrogenase accessory sulfurtransferase FdhD [Thiohalophilus sp.]